jgi:hypothetical protein
LVLAELGFIERLGGARARLTALAAALLPDVDRLLPLLHPPQEAYFVRGGPTHSFLFVALVSPLLGLLGAGGNRSRRNAACMLVLAVLSLHLALDAAGPWGVSLTWPINNRRLSADWLFPGDGALWMLLCSAYVFRLWGCAPGLAAPMAAIACGLYVGLMGAAHGVACKQASALARLDGIDVEEVHAFPQTPGGLFWNTVAGNEEELVLRSVDLLAAAQPGFRMDRGLEEPLVQEFVQSPTGRRWDSFARVAVATSAEIRRGEYEVWVRDLRFLRRFGPEQGQGVPFDLRARFNDAGQLLDHVWYVPGLSSSVPVPLPLPPPPSAPVAGSKGG